MGTEPHHLWAMPHATLYLEWLPILLATVPPLDWPP